MANRILSWFFLFFIAISSVLFFLIAVVIRGVTAPFDRRLVMLHLFSSFWASFYVWCMPAWTVTINGREKLDWKKSYLLVSNHQSQLDILVAFGLFFPFKWVSKAAVFKGPLIGWNMWMNRYIGLKRGDRDSIAKMMHQCEAALSQGCSLFFFPEGTRSHSGVVGPFKTGAFTLARKMNRPIIPIAISGTREALPKYSMVIQKKQHIQITILDEIPGTVVAKEDSEVLARRVRDLIAAHVHVPAGQPCGHAPPSPGARARCLDSDNGMQ